MFLTVKAHTMQETFKTKIENKADKQSILWAYSTLHSSAERLW